MAKKILRKLTFGPGVVVSAAIILLLGLLGMLNFKLPTTEESSGEAREERTDETKPATNSLVAVESLSPGETSELSEPSKLEPIEIVDVLIDGDDYWVAIGLQDGELQREVRTIGEITRAGRQCDGDESGVRVRVTRTFDATAQAEQALLEALTEAGLSGDEIDRRRTLITRPAPAE